MVVILDENKFLEKLIAAVRPLQEVKISTKQDANDGEWLLLKDAKRILPYQSKKKWKHLRDSNAIEFSAHGRQFLYNKLSLLKYILSKSTLSGSINHKDLSTRYSKTKNNKKS